MLDCIGIRRSTGRIVVTNVGTMLSGDLTQPVLDADTIVIQDGVIEGFGHGADCDIERVQQVVNAKGATVLPGLIDSHVHPTMGEWSPRSDHPLWITHSLHGGVTQMVSAGEVHVPGRPVDRLGVKALAIAVQRSFANHRPGGVKLIAGAPLLEQGLDREDIEELARAGVTLLGEVGIGSLRDVRRARELVQVARDNGMTSLTHTGGPSIPDSRLMDAEAVLEIDPDIIGHINGGHTALPHRQIRCLCEACGRGLEIVHNGNELAALYALRTAREMGQLHRVILGTDSPAGTGVLALGMLRLIALLSSFGDLPAEQAFCLATGNTARQRRVEGGLIAPGKPADLVIADCPQGSAGRTLLESVQLGDLPGIGLVMVDGVILVHPSKNTPPTATIPEITEPKRRSYRYLRESGRACRPPEAGLVIGRDEVASSAREWPRSASAADRSVATGANGIGQEFRYVRGWMKSCR